MSNTKKTYEELLEDSPYNREWNGQYGRDMIESVMRTWDDLRISANTVRVPGSKYPGWGAFLTSLQALWFDPNTQEEVYFTAQLPHSYKQGSDINAHVHWVPAAKATGTVTWGLEYSWCSIGGTFANPSTTYGNVTVQGDSTNVANKHYITEVGTISGTTQSVSSMIVCRLFRDSTGRLAADTYTGDAGLLEFDFHFERDSIGSREEYTK